MEDWESFALLRLCSATMLQYAMVSMSRYNYYSSYVTSISLEQILIFRPGIKSENSISCMAIVLHSHNSM